MSFCPIIKDDCKGADCKFGHSNQTCEFLNTLLSLSNMSRISSQLDELIDSIQRISR